MEFEVLDRSKWWEITSVFKIVLRGKEENPPAGEIRHFAGRRFLSSGGNLQGVILTIWTFFKAKNIL